MPLARRDDRKQDVRGGGCLDEEAVAGDARLLLRAFLPVRAVDIGRQHHSVARWRHQIAFDYDPARVRHP